MKKALTVAIKLEHPIDPFSELIQDQKKKLFDFIRKRVPEKEDAEDILQDVFFLFIQTTRSVKHIEHITSWLFRVAKNKIVDLYRKKKPEPLTYLEIGGKSISVLNSDELENLDFNDPDKLLRKKEFWSQFEHSIKALPEKQSQVFILNEMDGLSFKEISEITGASINTLLSRKRYAVLQLRKNLKNFQDSQLGKE